MMKITPTAIPEVIILEPDVFVDDRGFFFESFNQKRFEEAVGRTVHFVQDNHSKSVRGVLRGLHYQLPPRTQAKNVRVIHGEVFDVAVDIRKSSPTYGEWVGVRLTSENKKQLWIPEGFAHGFVTLSSTAEILYKTTDFYAKDYERTIIWNDTELGIAWNLPTEPLLSMRDSHGTSMFEAEVFE